MLKRTSISAAMLLLALAGGANAQSVTVSRANKTIAVSVSETVYANAEIAELELRYLNYGRTKELAFEENARASNKILLALLDAGLQKEDIETKSVKLERVDFDPQWPPEIRKERQFEAKQIWAVRVSVADAERLLSVAVDAGVTEIGEVEWKVADWAVLETKANAAALAKARAQAQLLAKEMGCKVGEILYVSNRLEREQFVQQFWKRREIGMGGGGGGGQKPSLKLFPQKVSWEATVQAVFALE